VDFEFRVAEQSHVGMVREHNEDRIGVWQAPHPSPWGPLAVVADGLGGHAAGEVASQIAIDYVLGALEGIVDAGDPGDIAERLAAGMRDAHEEILREASDSAERHGMGTTCTALSFHAGCMFLAHVGDSRAYRLRNGELEQLTHDHTVAAALARDNLLKPSEVDKHPGTHILTRALGMAESLTIETHSLPEPIRRGDQFMLCSDGLTGQVSAEKITEVLQQFPPDAAAKELVRLACEAGGPDNVSVVLLAVV
jgi:protein phosphatase